MPGLVSYFIVILANMTPLPKPMASASFLSACSSQESTLAKYFAEEKNWLPERKEEMLIQLQVVGILRPKGAIPLLLKHLTYEDIKQRKYKRIPSTEQQYPVYGALKKFGADVIPDLVKHLRRDEPVLDDRDSRLESNLAFLLFGNVSDDVKIARVVARLRIQCEIDSLPNANQSRLKALLGNN